jgi:hypothetical protein
MKMKYILTISLLVILNLTFGQSKSERDTLISNPNYDKAFAEKLGGDDYGMKSYFLVILKTGKNKTIEKAKEILQTDLTIQNELLDYEIFTWYGSAALPEYLPFSDKIWKSKP